MNSGTLIVTQSTFSGNSASFGAGGGIDVSGGTAMIDKSTFIDNHALIGGGGIWNGGGTLTVTNSTFSSNSDSGFGGSAIAENFGTASVTNTTVSGNSCHGPGGQVLFLRGTSFTLTTTIVANNTCGSNSDTSGAFTSGGHNLIEGPADATGFIASDLLSVDPQLGPSPTTAARRRQWRSYPRAPRSMPQARHALLVSQPTSVVWHVRTDRDAILAHSSGFHHPIRCPRPNRVGHPIPGHLRQSHRHDPVRSHPVSHLLQRARPPRCQPNAETRRSRSGSRSQGRAKGATMFLELWAEEAAFLIDTCSGMNDALHVVASTNREHGESAVRGWRLLQSSEVGHSAVPIAQGMDLIHLATEVHLLHSHGD